MRAPDRGRRKRPWALRYSGRPRGAPLCAGGPWFGIDHSGGVVAWAAGAVRAKLVGCCLRVDHYLSLRAGTGCPGRAGDRNRPALPPGNSLKIATALERLAEVDTVIFDKTGTLTEPNFMLAGMPDEEAFRVAASLAGISRHPLARALLAASGPVPPVSGAVEYPGSGIAWAGPEGEVRLGSRSVCRITGAALLGDEANPETPELWL